MFEVVLYLIDLSFNFDYDIQCTLITTITTFLLDLLKRELIWINNFLLLGRAFQVVNQHRLILFTKILFQVI